MILAGINLCWGVPAKGSRCLEFVSSFSATPNRLTAPSSSLLSIPSPLGSDICPDCILSVISTETIAEPDSVSTITSESFFNANFSAS